MLCASTLKAVADRFQLEIIEKRGRFAEERNFEVWFSGRRLLVAKCFNGRPPYYGRWIEVFAVVPRVESRDGVFVLAGSELESQLLAALSSELSGGDLIYVEYGYDPETESLLRKGLPPHVTRLGFLLLKLGFTVQRDFYFPEGFMEGEPKLQGEKPTSEDTRRQHLYRIASEVESSLPLLKRLANDQTVGLWARKALERAQLIVRGLNTHYTS